MATKTTTTLIDDIDDGPAEETVSFALDGSSYEIDLNEGNAKKLRDALAHFVAHARRARGSSSSASTSRSTSRRGGGRIAELGYTVEQVRSWAKGQSGISIGDKGRIPNDVVDAYHEFQQSGGKPKKATANGSSANGSAAPRKAAAKKAAAKKATAAASG